jgi:hypothetical protein
MLRAIDRCARGVFSPDDVRILVAAFGDGTHSVQAFFTIRTREAMQSTASFSYCRT